MDFDKKDGFSYLDNIPFKVSSAFLPPPSVVLPPVLNTDEELFFEKYDFSREKKILEDIKKKEEHSKSAHQNATKTENISNKSQNPTLDSSAKCNVQNMFSLQSDILLPKPQKIFDKVSSDNSQNNSKINFSDFENDSSSPFDYVELQTINDLEELSNVFQGFNFKYNSDDNVYKESNSDVIQEILQQANNSSTGSVSKSMSFPLQNNDGFEGTEKHLACPKEGDSDHSDWSVPLPKENAYPVPSTENLGFVGPGQSLARTLSSAVPKVPCLPLPSVKNYSVKNGFPDLSLTRCAALRGCRSYSDIHRLSEQEPEDFSKQRRTSTPPSAIEIKSTPSPVHENETTSGDANCDNPTGLPDPYCELSEEDQKFVDAIADMGFLKAQVSRSVKHLGSDEKTVVEHLCQIQTLEESGYDCLEAEAALHLHDYNQDQAKQFLDLILRFQDLGFEKDAVKKALIQNKNDPSKTIDALLS